MDRRQAHDEYERTAVRVSAVSIAGNTVLSLLKLIAGVVAHSGAMVSDAVHSASDVFSSLIVIIGVKSAAKVSDREHPYGHERFECVAAIVLAVVLCVTGLFIGWTAIGHFRAENAEKLTVPGLPALVAAVVSIAGKEAMYRYTRRYARRFDSDALMADAWHHRSDALSSVGALIGVAGARIGLPILDPVASLVICLFIIKVAYDVFRDAVGKMVDRSCGEALEREILQCAAEQEAVLGVDLLRTRVFGNRVYVDMEIRADGQRTLSEAHEAAQRVHDAIEKRFSQVKHIMVHVNPAK